MLGLQVTRNVRIYGYKRPKENNEEFFIECRNFSKSTFGLLGALLKDIKKGSTSSAELILTQGLKYDEKNNDFKLCYQRLKSGVSYQSLIENKNNDEFINKNLIFEELSSKSKGEIIYLNVLRPNEANPEQSIQSDMCSPDSILTYQKSGEHFINLNSEQKKHIKLICRSQKEKKQYIPNMLNISQRKHIMYISKTSKKTKEIL